MKNIYITILLLIPLLSNGQQERTANYIRESVSVNFWLNESPAIFQNADGQYAYTKKLSTAHRPTLKFSEFGFTIPATATVNSLSIRIWKYRTGKGKVLDGGGNIYPIVLGSGDQRYDITPDNVPWSSTPTVTEYLIVSKGELLFTPYYINASNRASSDLTFIYSITIATGTATLFIDKLSITVNYTDNNVSSSQTSTALLQRDSRYGGEFNVRVLNNPCRTAFGIQLLSPSTEPISLRVTDSHGRLIEFSQKISANQVYNLGEKYFPGVYYAEITQGKARKILKLVKL
jgi:hypothetical protein